MPEEEGGEETPKPEGDNPEQEETMAFLFGDGEEEKDEETEALLRDDNGDEEKTEEGAV